MLTPTSKTRVYASPYAFNRGLEITLLSLEQLEQAGIFQADELHALRVSLEHTRAQANEELTETLQQYESEQAAHFDHVEQEWERQFKDPDDVFFAAADRKKEIREQIKALQKGLAREKASPKQIRKQK